MKNFLGPIIVGALSAFLTGFALLSAAPILLMNIAIDRIAERGAINQMLTSNLPSPENQPVVRAAPDLAYSACPFDLRPGPLLLTAVPVPDHYTSLSVFDGRTDVAFIRNDLDADGQPIRIAVALEGQAVPAGIETIRVDKPRGIALVRIVLADRGESSQIDAIRRQSSCRTIL